MSQLIYLDTNIYIDYFEGRVDYLRPLGEFAFNVIRKTIGCEFRIMISQVVTQEIEYNNYKDKLLELIKTFKERNKIESVDITEEDRIFAKSLSIQHQTSFNDMLHYVIAKKYEVEIFVTRNVKDFPKLDGFPEIVFPENL